MQKTYDIELDVLPETAKKELLDFYEYLVVKYSKKRKDVTLASKKKAFFSSIKEHQFRLPAGYKFNRDEIHER
jgi:hypothetical protein